MNQTFHADRISINNTCIVTVGSTTPTTRGLFVQEKLFGNSISIDRMFEPKGKTKQSNYNPLSSSIQFIIKLPQQVSYSSAVEVLGQPTRKGKLLIWPNATLEQQVKMAAIDMIHDRVSYLKDVTVSYSDDIQNVQINF